MSLSELPSVVVDELGVLRFNGRTAEERLAALDLPTSSNISCLDRTSRGVHHAGRREGIWRYSIESDEHFVVTFHDDVPIDPPGGWVDDEWPRPSLYWGREDRALLEIFLREYRGPDDIGRIYKLMLPREHNSIPFIHAVIHALGVRLDVAKIALDEACDLDKRLRR